jgi:hypothetical protein
MDQKAKQMSNLIKKDYPAVDNFDGWNDDVEGNDRPQGAGIIQGTLVKFTNEATWVTRDDEEITSDLELVAVDVIRVVQKWCDGKPVETTILEPGQNFPDLEEMNAKVPQSEWVEGLYLVNLATMDKYTYPTGTAGGRIAVGDLRDKLVWMRRVSVCLVCCCGAGLVIYGSTPGCSSFRVSRCQ